MTLHPFDPHFRTPLQLPVSTRRAADPTRPAPTGLWPVRRSASAEDRAAHRLSDQWHVVDWRPLAPPPAEGKSAPMPGFLAIGPGGIFTVSVVQHGRSRVMIAGDVVQIQGKRPPYVSQARKDAKLVAKTLSAAIGRKVSVFPVLAFVGTGPISVNGLPKDCVVTSHRELDQVLSSAGKRISAATADKLSRVARIPGIWADDAGYRWYPEGEAPGDKGSAQ